MHRISLTRLTLVIAALAATHATTAAAQQAAPRARDLGIAPGVFRPGAHNAITDVTGVRVGQVTVQEGDSVRTGVTAILPHAGNLYLERVPAALHVGNGFGKLVGVTQLRELGELETPIVLTCTLCVWPAAQALADWMLVKPGMERVRSINPVVGETNDGGLNLAIRRHPITQQHVWQALDAATGGSVAEGSVGAGTGTVAFGWKAGIGTSSRVLPATLGGYSVGVLVQANFGGMLQILGAPVGQELQQYDFRGAVEAERGERSRDDENGGSIMIVVATDAPLSDRNLERLAARAMLGVGRTGGYASNGSGDYVLAFSTAAGVRRVLGENLALPPLRTAPELSNDAMSPLFAAAVEATEEAIYNALVGATAVSAGGRTVQPLPLDRVRGILKARGIEAPR